MLMMLASVFTMGSCSSNNDDPVSTNPFDNITESSNKERDKIVIISDLHLGNDLTYSENVKHLKRLEEFLGEVRSSGTVKELVIGGDMFDEWYIPTRSETYPGGSQADFIKKSVKANQGGLRPAEWNYQGWKDKADVCSGESRHGFYSRKC